MLNHNENGVGKAQPLNFAMLIYLIADLVVAAWVVAFVDQLEGLLTCLFGAFKLVQLELRAFSDTGLNPSYFVLTTGGL